MTANLFFFFSGNSFLLSEERSKGLGFNCKLRDATVIFSLTMTKISVAV
jgi:hypothetical protein